MTGRTATTDTRDGTGQRKAARREAVIEFARRHPDITLARLRELVDVEVRAGRMPGPTPDQSALWKWTTKAGLRGPKWHQGAAEAARGIATPKCLDDLAPPRDCASHRELVAQLAALWGLLERLGKEVTEAGRLTRDLGLAHRAEVKKTGAAFEAERRRRPWSDEGIRVRISCLRRLLRQEEQALAAASAPLHDPDATSSHRDESSLTRASVVHTTAHDSPASAQSPSPGVLMTAGIAPGSGMPLYARPDDDTREPWVAALERAPEPALGAVLGFDREPKAVTDARVRERLMWPVLSGTMTAEECAAAWRSLFRGQTTPANALLEPPDDRAQLRYRDLAGRTLTRWIEKWRAAEEAAREHARSEQSIVARPEARDAGDAVRDANADVDDDDTNAAERTAAISPVPITRPRPHVSPMVALMHRQRGGARGSRALPPEALEKACALYRDASHSAVSIADLVNSEFNLRVSARTYQRLLARVLSDDERARLRGGPEAEDVLLRTRLIREAPYPNRAWIIDNSFFTSEVWERAHPEWISEARDIDLPLRCRAELTTGRVAVPTVITRVTMSLVEDACTRRHLALRLWERAPNTRSTLLTLRDAMARFGVPELLYSDNGSDYRSELTRRALSLAGVKQVFSRPYRPQGRGKLERAFRTIKERILPHIPGYVLPGEDPTDVDPRELPTLRELEQDIWRKVEQVMNGKPHSETGRVPRDHYDELAGARGLGAAPVALWLPLLVVQDNVPVREVGLHANGRRYVGPGITGLTLGTRVHLFTDPGYPEVAYVAVRDAHGVLQYAGLVKSYGGDDPVPQHDEWTRLVSQWDADRERYVSEKRAAIRVTARRATAQLEGERIAGELVTRLADEAAKLAAPRTLAALPPANSDAAGTSSIRLPPVSTEGDPPHESSDTRAGTDKPVSYSGGAPPQQHQPLVGEVHSPPAVRHRTRMLVLPLD